MSLMDPHIHHSALHDALRLLAGGLLFLAVSLWAVGECRADGEPASTPPPSTPPASTSPPSTPPESTLPPSTPPASTPPASTPPAESPSPSKKQMKAGKEFFLRGQKLFEEGKYGAAWLEFSSAYEITSHPDLLVNMARCKEKTNQLKEAIDYYREFLRLRPNDPEGPQINAEITRLEQQIIAANPPAPAPSSSPPPATPRRFPIIGTALAGGAVLFLVFGGIAVGVGNAKFDELSITCKPTCTDDQVQSARTPFNAGYAMFSLAAISAVAAAVVLPFELGLYGRGKSQEKKVALGLGLGSMTVAGRF